MKKFLGLFTALLVVAGTMIIAVPAAQAVTTKKVAVGIWITDTFVKAKNRKQAIKRCGGGAGNLYGISKKSKISAFGDDGYVSSKKAKKVQAFAEGNAWSCAYVAKMQLPTSGTFQISVGQLSSNQCVAEAATMSKTLTFLVNAGQMASFVC